LPPDVRKSLDWLCKCGVALLLCPSQRFWFYDKVQQTHTHTHTHTCKCIHIHAHKHTDTRRCMHTHAYKHTHTLQCTLSRTVATTTITTHTHTCTWHPPFSEGRETDRRCDCRTTCVHTHTHTRTHTEYMDTDRRANYAFTSSALQGHHKIDWGVTCAP